MKNHVKVNGKLLQTNKSFSQLKNSQKEWIHVEFQRLYHDKMRKNDTPDKLTPNQRDEVINILYEMIQEREIWIPFGEVKKFCYSKISKAVRKFKG